MCYNNIFKELFYIFLSLVLQFFKFLMLHLKVLFSQMRADASERTLKDRCSCLGHMCQLTVYVTTFGVVRNSKVALINSFNFTFIPQLSKLSFIRVHLIFLFWFEENISPVKSE